MHKTQKHARTTSEKLTSRDEPTQVPPIFIFSKKLTPEQCVPKPMFDRRPQSELADIGQSEEVCFQQTLVQAQRRVQNFVTYADKIHIPLQL
ncbi:hypothetical protein Hypma_005253 [Hypsizygus marmoreus]|uniref:Uncharacterized protein n=1 Tax=Hypsizygus marmoreus TaxID=39966 RepID=A0A369K4T6_HYPMA|nr:hypothetical protein Hypma_005253 [Hypsizygus marmoreus]